MATPNLNRVDSEFSTIGPKGHVPLASRRTGSSRFRSQVADSHARVTEEVARDAPPAPKETENFLIYFLSMALCMGAVAYGYDTGFFGGTIALPSFRRDFGFDVLTPAQRSERSANFVSLFQGGSFFGAALQLPMTERYGRKISIIISNVIFIGSALMQVFATGSPGLMMGGRFLGGIAIGISSLVIPVYLAEIAPPRIRGRIVGFYDINIQVGTAVGFWINFGLQKNLPSNRFQWQLPTAVQIFPAAILGLFMFFLPESPRYLMGKGRFDEAEKILSRVRKLSPDHEYLQWEIAQTRAQVEAENAIRGDTNELGLMKQLFQAKGHRTRLFLGMALIFFKTFSGVQAVNYYSPRIFEQLGFAGTQNALFATGIYGTVKFVFTVFFGFFIVDRIGRRKPLMVGSAVGAGCLFYLGFYLTFKAPVPRPADYSAIVAIFLYAAWYCLGWNSVPLTLISEIFSLRFKLVSMTLCLMWQWLCTFSVVRIMPAALSSINTKTYFIFASIFIWAIPFVYFLIPETSGLPLEAMDNLFGGIERTPAELAVLSEFRSDGTHQGSKTENKGTSSHVEHSGEAFNSNAVANGLRTIDEK